MSRPYVSLVRGPVRRESELGTERQCTCCQSFWPEDREFFATKRGRVLPECRACTYERKARERRAA
jgi:hypothetical protein